MSTNSKTQARMHAVKTIQPDAMLLLVVPCYNEATRVNQGAFLKFLSTTSTIQILFVDDGSTDNTLALLKQMQALVPKKIGILELNKNQGKAEAVRQGLLHAGQSSAPYLGYWDADLATPLSEVKTLLRVARKYESVQLVYGARRAMVGHRIERTLHRRAISFICASLARIALRLPISDTQCGAKIVQNTTHLRQILKKPFTSSWLFDIELFCRIAAKTKDRSKAFYEYPLCEWTEIPGSKVNNTDIIKCGFQMLRLIAVSRFPAFSRL